MMIHDRVNILVISGAILFLYIYNILYILTMRISAGFKESCDSDGQITTCSRIKQWPDTDLWVVLL